MKSFFTPRASHALIAFLCAAFVLSFTAHGQDSPNAERFKQLTRKSQAGEALTSDEQAFVDRVREDIRHRAAAQGGAPAAKPAAATPADGEWEKFADGSTGQETEYHGVGGVSIPAYVRKPKGDGPFPVVVLLHGGRYGKGATVGLGRSMQSPTADFIKAGWAIYSIDYRPSEKIAIVPIEFDDSVEAVKAARKLPFVDPSRVGLMGGSHGAQVSSRVVSRVDVSGAVLCAPAAIDLIEDKKAAARGEKVVSILLKMAADMEKERGAPAEEIEKDPVKYGYSSALTEVAAVRAPILIINGRDDDNSPVSIIDLYVQKLRDAGKSVETYLPDNGPHGFYFGRPDIPESKEAARLAVGVFPKMLRADLLLPTRRRTPAAPSSARTRRSICMAAETMDWVDTRTIRTRGI